MLLTDDGEIIDDRFTRVADESPIPDDAPILVSATRFLERASDLTHRHAPVGVIWPNDKNVSELVPFIGKIALVALIFPNFRDGRAYSQARQLRERHGYRGELRATGDVLRDQFLFMLRAGFDSFEPRKEHEAAEFTRTISRYSVYYQPTGDGRIPALQLRVAHKRPAHGEECDVGVDASPANLARLNQVLDDATPTQIIANAIQTIPNGRLAVVSSFGIESAALLKLVADLDRSLPIIFLDTGWLFGETLAYRDELVGYLGLKNVRTIKPSAASVATTDPDYSLWARDPGACCHLRKVVPLAETLTPFAAWITGRKRYQGAERASLPIVEADGPRLKFNPFARVSPKDIAAIFRSARLPRHPLSWFGFTSVGCVPCTSQVREGEAIRAGRWRGTDRTECGIHVRSLSPTTGT